MQIKTLEWYTESTAVRLEEGSQVLIKRCERKQGQYEYLSLCTYFRPDWIRLGNYGVTSLFMLIEEPIKKS